MSYSYYLILYITFFSLGINIVRKSLRVPALTISKNAGVDAHVVVEKVLNSEGDVGYDARNNEYVNLIDAGILDPTKVSSTFAFISVGRGIHVRELC